MLFDSFIGKILAWKGVIFLEFHSHTEKLNSALLD